MRRRTRASAALLRRCFAISRQHLFIIVPDWRARDHADAADSLLIKMLPRLRYTRPSEAAIPSTLARCYRHALLFYAVMLIRPRRFAR